MSHYIHLEAPCYHSIPSPSAPPPRHHHLALTATGVLALTALLCTTPLASASQFVVYPTTSQPPSLATHAIRTLRPAPHLPPLDSTPYTNPGPETGADKVLLPSTTPPPLVPPLLGWGLGAGGLMAASAVGARLALLATSGQRAGVQEEDLQTEAERRFEQDNPWALFLIFTLGSFGLLFAASLPVSIGDAVRGGDWGTAAGNAAVVGLLAVLLQGQVQRRSMQIATMKRELELGDVPIDLPGALGDTRRGTLRNLRGTRRVCLLYGPAPRLAQALTAADVYRRRFAAAGLLVVPVLSSEDDTDALRTLAGMRLWVTQPVGSARWRGYFEELLGSGAMEAYVTLGTSGRVRGSGRGTPRWDALLATFPKMSTEAVAKGAATEGPEAEVLLGLHREFYRCIVGGHKGALAELWGRSGAEGQDGVITALQAKGARLDPWDTVLAPDRRPVGMTITDADVHVAGDDAWVTAVETAPQGATLLATQRFRRSEDGGWLLTRHRTVPWGVDTVAQVVLRCDARGCVAVPAKAATSYDMDQGAD